LINVREKELIYKPIGIIHSQFTSVVGVPIQPSGAEGIGGVVEVFDEFYDGLKSLDGFSHIILIYHFHLANGFQLEVIPFLDKKSHGVFATRAPNRPNSIGMSVVKVKKVEQNRIYIENVDIIDGTPLLDIKPYASFFDNVVNEKNGWLSGNETLSKKIKSDERFK